MVFNLLQTWVVKSVGLFASLDNCVCGRAALISLHLSCKSKLFFLRKVINPPSRFYPQIQCFKEVQSEMFGYLWVLLFKASKCLLYISIQIIIILFFTLAGERTSASQGWSDCSWSGLVSLQCPVLVFSPVFVCARARLSAWSHVCACTHWGNFIDNCPNTIEKEHVWIS